MSTQHTPGPWHRNIRAAGKYPTVYAGRNAHIAVVKQAASPEETEANIDLIAAAPDLLDALRMIADWADSNVADPALNGPLGYARAAIAKATGEQK